MGDWTRRQVLLGGLGGLAAAGLGGAGLVAADVLPGRSTLRRLMGACSVAAAEGSDAPGGEVRSGTFESAARRRTVGYSVAYPPGQDPASAAGLPLVLSLHAHGGDHQSALSGLAVAAPVVLASVDGGNGYWHRHPGDDPMGMLVDEFLPHVLGRPGGERIGVIGVSMGGYGALLLAQRRPDLVAAVAAISPAVWRSYGEARGANRDAFESVEDFAAHDVIRGAPALGGTAVRVHIGRDDPFLPGVEALGAALPAGTEFEVSKGCHTSPFFDAAAPQALAFVAARL